MDGLEAGVSGRGSGDSSLHAFSLVEPVGARVQVRAARTVGWRQSVADLWCQIATGDLFGCRQRSLIGSRAKRLFAVAHQDLIEVWKGPGVSRRSVLRNAAVALECSARVWQAFGPVAGDRRLHLLRRLEQTLAQAERDIRAGELSLLVNRASVTRSARAAGGALDDLLAAGGDRAEGLARLEDAAVELAVLAIRIATNLHLIGRVSRARPKQSQVLAAQLRVLAHETSAQAERQREALTGEAEGDHLGVWLSSALKVAPSRESIQLAVARNGDRTLRADALCALRARWLELAVGLWLIVQAHDELLQMRTFDDDERLQAAVISRACSTLMASALCGRPDEFDHARAWECHREALCELVSDSCLALQTCQPDAVVRSQQLALRRLSRAVAAIWTIDNRARSRLGQRSERAVPLGVQRAQIVVSETYDARLARAVLHAGPEAPSAAMAFLERNDPATLDAAVALIAPYGAIKKGAFDFLADAWETYRHLRHLSWD